MSRSKHASLLINTAGFISNVIGLYCVHVVYENPYAEGFGGHFQYLTILGLTASTFAFALRILRFFLPNATPNLHDAIVFLALPLEGLICALYWTMCFIDPGLLNPKDMPPIPAIIDCILHLHPAILLWIDFLAFTPDFKRSWAHTKFIAGFGLFYYAWSWWCNNQNGYWPYPFLNTFTSVGRMLFYITSVVLCWIIYELGTIIHAKIHSKPIAKKID